MCGRMCVEGLCGVYVGLWRLCECICVRFVEGCGVCGEGAQVCVGKCGEYVAEDLGVMGVCGGEWCGLVWICAWGRVWQGVGMGEGVGRVCRV